MIFIMILFCKLVLHLKSTDCVGIHIKCHVRRLNTPEGTGQSILETTVEHCKLVGYEQQSYLYHRSEIWKV